MLGYITLTERGAADRLLFSLARTLTDRGWTLAGAVQSNIARPDVRHVMQLHVLSLGQVVRISQDLGPGGAGCSLDPSALETAVGLAEAALLRAPRLCIVNKFGRVEAEGGGFRAFIGAALAAGVPVLTSVGRDARPAFDAFADGMADPLPGDIDALLAWCDSVA